MLCLAIHPLSSHVSKGPQVTHNLYPTFLLHSLLSSHTGHWGFHPQLLLSHLLELSSSHRLGKASSHKTPLLALAGVGQWIERRPANQSIAGLNPSRGTCLGCRPGARGWGVRDRQPHIDVSLPVFLPHFVSL